MKQKRVIEEVEEICSLCGGRGVEASYNTTAMTQTCRQCGGARYIVTKRTIRYEHPKKTRGPRSVLKETK